MRSGVGITCTGARLDGRRVQSLIIALPRAKSIDRILTTGDSFFQTWGGAGRRHMFDIATAIEERRWASATRLSEGGAPDTA